MLPFGDNTWLVAKPRKDGGYLLRMVTYLPLEQSGQQGEDEFTALLEVTDWQGNHEFAVLYRKDGIPLIVSREGRHKPTGQILRMAVDNNGPYVCVQVGTLCVVVIREGEDPDHATWSCRGEYRCYFSDGTPVNPNDYPEFPIDEDGPEYWYGQQPHPTGNPNPNTIVLDTTMSEDFYNDARLRCIMDKLMADNFFKKTVNNFIGENKPINLNFKLGILEPLTLGNAQPIPLVWNATNIDITLNSEELNNVPALQVALTLLHEGVHAEIFRKLLSIQGPSNLNNVNFPTLFQYYVDYGSGGMQHAYMADHYINILGNALWEFDGKLFSLDHYKALSWQGLHRTNVFLNKSQSEKDLILLKQQELLAGRNINNCN